MYLLLAFLSCGYLSLAFPNDSDGACAHKPDAILLPHAARCDWFVECYAGVAYEKQCSKGLHFNTQRGTCDFPHVAKCKAGERYGNHFEPNYADLGSLDESSFFDERFWDPTRHTDTYPGLSHRPGYEETIYGVQPRHTNFDPQRGEACFPEYTVEALRAYASHVIDDAISKVKDRLHGEANYAVKMHNVVDSGPFRYVSAFMNAKPYVKYISLSAMSMIQALKLTQHKYKLGGPELYSSMKRVSRHPVLRPFEGVFEPDAPFPVPPDMNTCPYPKRYHCDPNAPFRTLDGTCNNLQEPIWGRSLTPFRRLLPQVYHDGIESMRQSVLGGPLPPARAVSLHLFPDRDRPEHTRTFMVMTFGQFLDHDLTRTAITKMSRDERFFETNNMEDVKCGFNGCESDGPGLEACWPIPIPEEDPDFRYNRCLKFVRSAEVPPLSCDYGPRDQLNQLTSWVDASMVYGSSQEEASKLRDLTSQRRGRMLTTPHPHGPIYKPLLPQDDNPAICRETNATVKCFTAGDERVNENFPLTVLHLVFVREHNRIEEQLHLVNPHWGGERLFQETRKIVAAIFQQVTYHEFLPAVLTPELMKRFQLELQPHGYFKGYDPTVDPRPTNVFATAAFRFGHTLIQERVRRTDSNYNFEESIMMSSAMRRPGPVYDTHMGGVDALIRGMCEQPCQTFDQFFTKQITRSLFTERPPHGEGMDLLSLNIQRGRDHGLPGYNAFRERCGLRRAYTFADLAAEVKDPKALQMLQTIYRHPDDIDIFAGGVSETVLPGASVGPTFGCIIADTFHNAKFADRFWYESEGPRGFTPEQLQSIRKVRMSRLMCENSDHVDRIQPNIFFQSANDYVPSLDDKSGDHNEYWFESPSYADDFVYSARSHEQTPPTGFRYLAERHPVLQQLPPGVAYNVRVPCESFPSIDLRLWREGPYTGYF